MVQKILRLRQVTAASGLSRSTIYSKIKAGEFPRPVKLGPKASGWIEAEMVAWQARRITERDAKVKRSDQAARQAVPGRAR